MRIKENRILHLTNRMKKESGLTDTFNFQYHEILLGIHLFSKEKFAKIKNKVFSLYYIIKQLYNRI